VVIQGNKKRIQEGKDGRKEDLFARRGHKLDMQPLGRKEGTLAEGRKKGRKEARM
jgi:hypothetical protein